MRVFPVAHIEIDDVWVAVIFTDSELQPNDAALRECAQKAGLRGSVVIMWKDTTGRKRFISEPAQRPFLESVRYDQLYAQRNRAINFPHP